MQGRLLGESVHFTESDNPLGDRRLARGSAENGTGRKISPKRANLRAKNGEWENRERGAEGEGAKRTIQSDRAIMRFQLAGSHSPLGILND
jgi:hypothetical protein